MSKASIGAGTKLQLGDGASPENFTAIAEIKSLKNSGRSIKTDEVTNMDSPADTNGVIWEEFIGTVASGGELDFTYNWIPEATGGQAAFRTAFDGKVHNFRIVTNRLNTANSPATKWTMAFAGLITTADELDFSTDKAVSGSGKIKVSGVQSWS